MNSEEQTVELQKIIQRLITLPANIQEPAAKALNLIVDDDPVVKIAVANFIEGKLTREQFLEAVESQYSLRQSEDAST